MSRAWTAACRGSSPRAAGSPTTTGFTGTSLYLAPETGCYLVICTNAVYHGNARVRIVPLRALALKTISANARCVQGE